MGSLLYSLLTLALATQFTAAIDCKSNLTISNANDAKEIRENCKSVGSLDFLGPINENINLDGLEEIRGDWVGVDDDSGLLNITSSTLKLVDGHIDFTSLLLQRLTLPKLRNVTGKINLDYMDNLTHVDLTNLEYVRNLDLKAPLLEEFKIDELKGFTGHGEIGGWINIYDGGKAANFDGLFKGPVEPADPELLPEIYVRRIPKVESLTLGWKRVQKVDIAAQESYLHEKPYPNITLTLGGPSTESMHIEDLELREGIIGIERGSENKNLTIGIFQSMNDLITDLSLPFHQISTIRIRGDRMTSLEVPQEAEQWKSLNMSIWLVRSLKLDSLTNSDGKRTWYWPKGNMSSFYLMGEASTDFFQPLIDGTTRVTESLKIIDFSGDVDCDKIENMNGTLPSAYDCSTSNKNAAAMSSVSNWLSFLMLICTIIVVYL